MPKKMFSWMNPNLEIRKTEKYGKGVFAKKDIKKNAMLAIFGGYIMTTQEEEKLPKKIKDYGVQIHNDFVLGIRDARDIKNDKTLFNHSCSPNAGFKGQIFLVAMKNIGGG